MKSIIGTQDNNNVAIPCAIAPSVDLACRVSIITVTLTSVDPKLIFPDHPQVALGAMAFFAALYLLLTTVLGYRRQNGEDNQTVRQYLGRVDSLLIGMGLILLPFNLSTSVAFLLIAAIRAVTIGGVPLLLQHTAILAFGTALAALAIQPTLTLHGVERSELIAIIVAALFIGYATWRMFEQQRKLATSVMEFNTQNLQLKLNNYKLAKYLSPSLRKAIFSGKRVTLETQRKRLSVFFSDIKGFSDLSEELEADTLTSMLNLYLTEMSDIALKFGGTVDKFIGDAIMVFFGDPVTKGAKDDCIACVSMAIAMQKRMVDLNKRWASQGIRRPLQIRVGINTGYCTVGNFGTENRLDYTLLGTQVNKASRLESAADPGEILISRQTYELIKDTIYCEPRGLLALKGYKEPVEAFAAMDLRANINKESPCVEHSIEGFTMFMDVENIPHMQKHRIMSSLEEAYEQLRKDIEFNTKEDVKIFK